MRATGTWTIGAAVIATFIAGLAAQQGASGTTPASGQTAPAQGAGRGNGTRPNDDIKQLVGRLDLERFKATLKGLVVYGDRREGTQRNRDAVTWIETQLRAYNCQEITRLKYDLPQRGAGTGTRAAGAAAGGTGQPAAARGGGRATVPNGQPSGNSGGSMSFGFRAPAGVNNDPTKQPDETLRALDMQPVLPGPIEEVFCTKVGSTHPNEIYIVGGHMDGIGYGQAANDDGSGATLVMELARIFSSPDVQTDRSIRFALWNGEEGGLHGSHAYADQRKGLQGIENPAGSGKYPEPKWLGMIQHDMMMWDHGMPIPKLDADGKPVLDANGAPVYAAPKAQRAEADINIEFQQTSALADQAMKLAFLFRSANEKYATNYPASVGPHMTNTDSDPFMDICPAISLRENERGGQIGAGWDPNWHQPTDVYTTYSDKDFLLGLNAAQTTLAAVAQLTGATLKK